MRRAEEAAERQKVQGSGPSFLEMQARLRPPPSLWDRARTAGRAGAHRLGACTPGRAAQVPHACHVSRRHLAEPFSRQSPLCLMQDRALKQQAAEEEERPTPQRLASKKSCEWGAGAAGACTSAKQCRSHVLHPEGAEHCLPAAPDPWPPLCPPSPSPPAVGRGTPSTQFAVSPSLQRDSPEHSLMTGSELSSPPPSITSSKTSRSRSLKKLFSSKG